MATRKHDTSAGLARLVRAKELELARLMRSRGNARLSIDGVRLELAGLRVRQAARLMQFRGACGLR